MRLNWSAFQRTKTHNSIEEAESERTPAKVRRLFIKEVELENLRGRLRQFSRLESLEFGWCPRVNYFSEICVEFSPELRAEILELERLRSFTVLNTNVLEFPLWLAPLPKLEYLMVRGTYIQEVPTNIKLFSQLRVLRLGNNDLLSIPVEVAELRKLEYLELGDTFISDIPLRILQLPKLRALGLAGTNFTPEGAAHIKAQFPNASVWPATATRLPHSHSYFRRESNERL